MNTIAESCCFSILKEKLGDGDSLFTIDSFSVRPIDEYLGVFGEYAELVIQATVNATPTSLKFFVKSTFQDQRKSETVIRAHDVFKKEFLFLTRILDRLEKYARTRITARCYSTILYHFTVLDDLTVMGFERTRASLEDFDHAVVAFRVLANFHAASLILSKEIDFFDPAYNDLLEETMYKKNTRDEGLFYSLCKKLQAISSEFIHSIEPGTIQRALAVAQNRITEFVHASTNFVNILTHGDSQMRNFMFKYNEKGEPLSGVLVDFQCVRFAPPVLDLIFFLSTGYSVKFRSDHGEFLLKLYYQTLKDCLKAKNVDACIVFPEGPFRESYEYYQEFAMLVDAFGFGLKVPREMTGKFKLNKELLFASVMHGDCEVNMEALRKCDDHRTTVVNALETLINFYAQ